MDSKAQRRNRIVAGDAQPVPIARKRKPASPKLMPRSKKARSNPLGEPPCPDLEEEYNKQLVSADTAVESITEDIGAS